MMDPNATLAEIREICAKTDADYDDAERLAELCRAMDDWLSKGGFLPDSWAYHQKWRQRR